MRIFRYLFILFFLVVGWLVGWSNHSTIEFSFLVWQLPPIPVYILYFLFLFTGVMIGLVIGRLARRR